MLNLLTILIHHLELHCTDHWHTQTSVLSVLQSPLAVSWQRLLPREIFQLPALRSSCHSRPCRTLVNLQLNWLGPRLAAISHQPLLVFSSQADFQLNWQLNPLTHQPATSRHFTLLNFWQLLTTNSLLQTVLLITSRHGPHRKHRFHCCSPTMPRPLHKNGSLFAYCLATADVYRVTA
jgi:hypothetical protein